MRARKRRERRASAKPVTFANPRLLDLARSPFRSPFRVTSPLRLVEDRRTFHPLDFFRPARQLSGHPVQPHRVARTNKAKPFLMHATVPSRIAFAAPKKTVICVRRSTRKEVLFAKRKTGRGARSKKHFNYHSQVSCK